LPARGALTPSFVRWTRPRLSPHWQRPPPSPGPRPRSETDSTHEQSHRFQATALHQRCLPRGHWTGDVDVTSPVTGAGRPRHGLEPLHRQEDALRDDGRAQGCDQSLRHEGCGREEPTRSYNHLKSSAPGCDGRLSTTGRSAAVRVPIGQRLDTCPQCFPRCRPSAGRLPLPLRCTIMSSQRGSAVCFRRAPGGPRSEPVSRPRRSRTRGCTSGCCGRCSRTAASSGRRAR
jgi:hypothetical protein